MKIINTKTKRTLTASIMFAVVSLVNLFMHTAQAQNIPGSLNLPEIYDAPIAVGDSVAMIDINASNLESMSIEVIVPIDSALVSLVDPDGAAVVTSTDPLAEFFPGDTETPVLPGGVYRLPTIAAPADGTYQLVVSFPPSAYKTGVLATVTSQSAVKAGIIIPGEQFLVGQRSVMAMLIVGADQQPVVGQSPSISVTSPSGVTTVIAAKDDGVAENFDGTANDGLYSISYVFDEAGKYQVEGTADVSVNGEVYAKKASSIVEAIAPTITSVDVAQDVLLGTNSCIASLSVTTTAQNSEAGLYVSSALISDANGNLFEKNANSESFSSGVVSPKVVIDSTELIDAGLTTSPFTLVQLKMLNFKPDSYSLEYVDSPEGAWATAEGAVVCAEAINIKEALTVTPQLQDGYIASLDFSFDIDTQSQGNYQTSFKITDASNQDVEVFGLSQFFNVGSNTVTVSIDASQLQNIDGPFTLESVLVIGGGNNAQLSIVGSSEAYSKWQYLPVKPGDLDVDGDVDSADRAILIGERGKSVFTPGDRRDLDRNGVIDVRDIRRIMYLR